MSCPRIRMIVDNQLDEFNLTATPPMVPTLPVENILDEHRSYIARSATITSTEAPYLQTITGMHNGDRTLAADGFALARHNMTGSEDTYRLILKHDGEIVFDSGEIQFALLIPLGIWKVGINWFGEPYDSAGLDSIKVLWFPLAYYNEFEIQIKKYHFSHAKQEYQPWIDVGHVFIGQSIIPEKNFNWGNVLSWSNGQELTRTQGGSLVTEGGHATYRELSLSFSQMSNRDRHLFSTNLRRTAGSPILAAAYPDADNQTRETEYTMIAKVKPENKWSHIGVDRHTTTLTLMEI